MKKRLVTITCEGIEDVRGKTQFVQAEEVHEKIIMDLYKHYKPQTNDVRFFKEERRQRIEP